MLDWLTPTGTPNSVGPMLLGYAFIFGTAIAYIVLLVIRRRNLLRDLDLIEQISKD